MKRTKNEDKMVAADIVGALKLRHPTLEWAFFEEFSPNTGVALGRIDVWVMSLWQSLGYRRISYEIKVSWSDFLDEMKRPYKRNGALEISNEFYFAAPKGLIKPDELPSEAGLIEFVDRGGVGPHEFWSGICRKCNDGPYWMKRVGIDPNGNCPNWQRMRGRIKVRAPVRDCPDPNLGLVASIFRRAQRQNPQNIDTPE